MKQSRLREAVIYQMINKEETKEDTPEQIALREMGRFTAKFYEKHEANSGVVIDIENLLYQLPYANYMDIKIGTSTVTETLRKKQD